jgi:hypothetical protein
LCHSSQRPNNNSERTTATTSVPRSITLGCGRTTAGLAWTGRLIVVLEGDELEGDELAAGRPDTRGCTFEFSPSPPPQAVPNAARTTVAARR